MKTSSTGINYNHCYCNDNVSFVLPLKVDKERKTFILLERTFVPLSIPTEVVDVEKLFFFLLIFSFGRRRQRQTTFFFVPSFDFSYFIHRIYTE